MARPTLLKRLWQDKGGLPAFEAAILSYLQDCKEKKEPATRAGLTEAAGLLSTATLQELVGLPDDPDEEERHGSVVSAERRQFTEVLKKGMLKVEGQAELDLAQGKGHPVGHLFRLKNYQRKSWRDKHEVEHTGDGVRTLYDEMEADKLKVLNGGKKKG